MGTGITHIIATINPSGKLDFTCSLKLCKYEAGLAAASSTHRFDFVIKLFGLDKPLAGRYDSKLLHFTLGEAEFPMNWLFPA